MEGKQATTTTMVVEEDGTLEKPLLAADASASSSTLGDPPTKAPRHKSIILSVCSFILVTEFCERLACVVGLDCWPSPARPAPPASVQPPGLAPCRVADSLARALLRRTADAGRPRYYGLVGSLPVFLQKNLGIDKVRAQRQARGKRDGRALMHLRDWGRQG